MAQAILPVRCSERLGTKHIQVWLGYWEKLEARGGIEPPIKVLQTFALPLGDRASGVSTRCWKPALENKKPCWLTSK